MTCNLTPAAIFRPLILLCTLVLASCSSTTSAPTQQPATPLSKATERLSELFSELSAVTQNLQTIKPIDQCRFEISTHWNSESQGHYRANHTQRFSLKHDLRAVDLSPNYIATFEGQQQQWQEKLQLTYNRLVPYQFNYYDSKTFEYHQNQGSDDQFSLVGFSQAPITLMKAIESTLVEIATLCGNDLSRFENINYKLLGYWNVADNQTSIGELTVATDQAQLVKDEKTIRGPYSIKSKGDYFYLSISPLEQEPVHIVLDFINSNYARIFIENEPPQNIQFSPLTEPVEGDDKQLHLIRLGDLL